MKESIYDLSSVKMEEELEEIEEVEEKVAVVEE